MKNNFNIPSEEKNRILNLHENRTKGLYLNEQVLAAPTYATTPQQIYTPKPKEPTPQPVPVPNPEQKKQPDSKVKEIQEKLKTLGYGQYLGKSGADGILGKNTLNAILLALSSPGVDVSKPDQMTQKEVNQVKSEPVTTTTTTTQVASSSGNLQFGGF